MKNCVFCIENKSNLHNELNIAMDEWALNKTNKNMKRACIAGKLVQGYKL